VGFVVDKVALGQVFLEVMFSPVNIILPWLSVLITAFFSRSSETSSHPHQHKQQHQQAKT
jgi:hypothetical protein